MVEDFRKYNKGAPTKYGEPKDKTKVLRLTELAYNWCKSNPVADVIEQLARGRLKIIEIKKQTDIPDTKD